MRLIFSLFLMALCLSSSPAASLDCEPAPLELAGLPEDQVIFEGPVLAGRELSLIEKGKLKIAGYAQHGGAMADLRIYTLSVQRNWQGTKKDAKLDILRDTSWGDKFEIGEEYLVFADRQGDFFEANICGHTTHSSHAAKRREFLIKNIGIGHDFRVIGEDMECDTDADCTLIVTHCQGCSCGTPVNITALDKYTKIREETCTRTGVQKKCLMRCPAITPRCIDYRCEM